MRRFASVSGADVPVIDTLLDSGAGSVVVWAVADLVDTAIDQPHYRK